MSAQSQKFRFYALWLCLICIVVFIIQTIFPVFTEMFLLQQDVIWKEPYRLLTSIFLHGSFLHLLYNMFALALFGSILEKTIGSKKFLAVFFISGLFASFVSIFFYDKALGASGAIYGIFGVLTLLSPMMVVWVYSLPMPMFLAAILWAIGDIIGIFIPRGIANLAHLSGMFIGILFGLYFLLIKKSKINAKEEKIKIPEYTIRLWEDKYILR